MDIQVNTHGRVGDADKDYARDKLSRLDAHAPGPILMARVRLAEESNPALEKPAVAEATIDVNGRIVRAHVAATQMSEAIDLLEDRLRRQLVNLSERYETARKRGAVHKSGEWRHGDLPTRRAERFERPIDEREVVRRKTLAVEPITLDEAAFDLEMLDHDFYLFTDADTGNDSVIVRQDDGKYALHSIKPPEAIGETVAVIEVVESVPPQIDLDSAVDRINQTNEPLIFFVEATTGRGNVLYHRYDGHYGVITAAD